MLYNIKIAIAYVAEKQYLCSEIINHLIIAIMKEKLTKNDSMSKSCSQICEGIFNTKSDFDAMVAAFEELLKQEGAHRSFFEEWAKSTDYKGTANPFFAWRESIKLEHPSIWLMNAFGWRRSKNGLDYWYAINKQWISWLKHNLNK